MDADRLGSYQKLLHGGLVTDKNSLAHDAYKEVKPGGHFLGSDHTMQNYKEAFYEPKLSDSENVERWEETGSQDMRKRAYERWNNMLDNYNAPDIDVSIKEELLEYVARRKREIPEAWY
jgi:trimethylamine--corrinoid protein Co-methyltransferase